MKRTTIVAPDELLAKLRAIAAERHLSMVDVIREALEQKAQAHRPPPRGLGMGASGHPDTARGTADEHPEPRSTWLQDLYEQFAPVRDEARALSEAEINDAIDDAVKAVRSKHA